MKKSCCLLFVLLLSVFFAACSDERQDAEKGFASVNGEEITREEMEYFAKRRKTDVLQEYAKQYDLTDFSDFWDRDFDGKTPAQALEEKAFSEAVRAKVVLLKMKEYGIYSDISFDGLKKQAQAFNRAHQSPSEKTAGINSIDMEQFYSYYIANGEMELKNLLAQGELKPTAAEIAEWSEGCGADEVSEEALVWQIVNQKYQVYVSGLVQNAVIQKIPASPD